jgi:hypothetical protein
MQNVTIVNRIKNLIFAVIVIRFYVINVIIDMKLIGKIVIIEQIICFYQKVNFSFLSGIKVSNTHFDDSGRREDRVS